MSEAQPPLLSCSSCGVTVGGCGECVITDWRRPAPQPLDVERLAEAMRRSWPTRSEGIGGTGDVERREWQVLDPAYPSDALTERIAEAYARLGSQEGSDRDE